MRADKSGTNDHHIVLVRHGRSHLRATAWLDQAALKKWLAVYDISGLMAGESPPAALVNDVAQRLQSGTSTIVSSDMLRAIESAALLAPKTNIVQSVHLRETNLTIPNLGRLRLPYLGWGLVMGLLWKRALRNEPVDAIVGARKQGTDACVWLESLLKHHRSVIAVTHGVTRQYIADALVSRGWRATQKRMPFDHWSAWEFAR